MQSRERLSASSIHHQMDLLKLIHSCVICFMVLVLLLVESAQSTVLIRFDRAPPALSRFSNAVFQYSIERINGTSSSSSSSNPCKTEHGCSIYCELDGKPLKHCPAGRSIIFEHLTANEDHIFLLNVTTLNGDRNSSAYKWFIDTISPTATISSENSCTNAEKTAIDITFSEACRGLGGFKCINTSSCDVSVDGPAYIDASTLQEVETNIKYRVNLVSSLTTTYGRVVIKMANNFCTDQAGNLFKRSNGSIIVVHFDRRPIEVELWTSIPSYELEINEIPRTVLATNKTEDLEIFVDFSDPVVNSTKDIQSVLGANVGKVVPIHSKSHNNRRFGFKLKDVPRTEAITVKLLSASIIGRSGSPASSVSPISFLYDSRRPGVKLTTRSPEVAKESNINVIVKFTEPVFGFQPADIEVVGGSITRFKELTKALYSLVILGKSQSVVSVLVPEGKAKDVAGNLNLASNQLEVRQHSTPTMSVALHSFVTAGLLTTSLAAVLLRLSCTNLAAIGAITSGTTNVVISNPSMNLLGMVGHLQVFVLSEWIFVRLPLEYFETTKGLRWLIPHEELPWKKENSVWANYDFPSEGRNELAVRPRNLSIGLPLSDEIANHSIQHSSNKTSSYGLPLDSVEYSIYFMREKALAGINVERVENYTGWKDLEMNLFWLGIGGVSLLMSHLSTILFLRWRTGTSVHGTLSAPRFELVILILMLPCISQSSAFVIRGGTTEGIIVGAVLLAIPAALILSVCMFLTVVIFNGSFVQYKEIINRHKSEPWLAKMLSLLTGNPTAGKWFYREGLPSSFLPRFGFLFEDRKGPLVYVTLNQNDLNSVPKWVDSGKTGIGRMRVVNFDDVNEEPKIPMSRKLVGCARSGYLILDLLRRVALGIISGAYSSPRPSQSIIAFSVTLVQFLYLFTLKPYIRRGVHVVESISLFCEAAIFGLSIYMSYWNSFKERTMGFLMLVLLFISFFAQLVNEWYALIKSLLRLSQSRNLSFKLGVKSVTKGLVLPFLPRKHWSKLLSGSSQPKTGLVPVLPLSPERESERENGVIRVNSLRAMTATIVPILSPGSPNLTNIQATGSMNAQTSNAQKVEGQKQLKEIKLEAKSELKKLRELARASFSGWIEEGSSSYTPREECDSNGSASDNIQAPSPNNRY